MKNTFGWPKYTLTHLQATVQMQFLFWGRRKLDSQQKTKLTVFLIVGSAIPGYLVTFIIWQVEALKELQEIGIFWNSYPVNPLPYYLNPFYLLIYLQI